MTALLENSTAVTPRVSILTLLVQILKQQLFDAKIWLTRHDTMDRGVSRFNPLLWPKPPLLWCYGIAVLSVTVALILGRWPALHLQTAPVSLFLCAVMLSAWFGELGPGLFATVLSALAFLYYFLAPTSSWAAKPEEIPRLLIFVVSALFVGLLSATQRRATESLRRSRDALRGTVQQLNHTNEMLRAESSEREDAENDLRRSQAYLAEAQRLSVTGSFGWRISSGELIWSEETFRIFAYDTAMKPTIGLALQRVHPEDEASVKQTIERASHDGKNFEHEYRLVMPDDSVKHVHVVAHASSDESGGVEFVGAVMDVTERKRAEAMRDGESRILEMIARDAPLGEMLQELVLVVEAQFAGLFCSVLLLDEDGQHVRHGAAPSLPEGYTKAIDGLCIGPNAGSCGTAMYRREPVVVTDILQDPLWEPYREVAESYGLRACWSTPILAHSGKALASFAMYYREPRSPSATETRALQMANHLAGIAIERKLAEEGLRQAQADLAHVSRTTTMGELTASLAHEVNQPIAAAVTSANSCFRWLAGDVPNLEKARAAAMRIVKDGTRAAEIIGRIRLLFQKGTPQWELVDVNEVIEEMIVLLRGEAMRHRISVRTELAADLPRVMADRVQLQQVMMNLMMNSIDAMKPMNGMRELGIKSREAESEQLLVSVSDTGVGLPPQQEDQIFNAFFTTKPHGTGMGLRICRSIVESHGGRLWAAHNPPSGAIFYFSLGSKVEARE